MFKGEDLIKLKAHQVADRGIARTFQNIELFSEMTVIDNLLLGHHYRMKTGFFRAMLFLPFVRKEEMAAREKKAAPGAMDAFLALGPEGFKAVVALMRSGLRATWQQQWLEKTYRPGLEQVLIDYIEDPEHKEDSGIALTFLGVAAVASIGGGVGVGRGAGVTVGHKVMLHGCTLGDNSLIGIGSTILNGATIGKNCLVGAHSLVTEGKSFPDGSLILGSPAKAVRELTKEEIAGMTESARHYVANAARFQAELREV